MPRANTTRLTVSEERIEAHYDVLSKIGALGADPSGGYLRAAYSNEESEAMRHFEREGRALGMHARWDEAGNLFLEIDGRSASYIEAGSHLDTVPGGGNFDGAAGIVAGFEAIRAVVEGGQPLERGLRLRIWRGEEAGTFNSVYTGSRAAFGLLDPRMLGNRFRGLSLGDAMASQGANLDVVRAGRRTIPQSEVDGIAAHLELHIEQGTVLENGREDIGVVTAIRGPRRFRVVLQGDFDHSGATPMGVDYRKDANLALATIIVRLQDLADEQLKRGADLVQTVGVINSDEDFNREHPQLHLNSISKVSGFAYFTLDVRSIDEPFLESHCAEIRKAIGAVAERLRVSVAIEPVGASKPVVLQAHALRELVAGTCDVLGLRSRSMASGAGHDVGVVASQRRSDGSAVPAALLFIPCRGGKSHSPDEFTTFAAIAKGSSVMANVMADLAGGA